MRMKENRPLQKQRRKLCWVNQRNFQFSAINIKWKNEYYVTLIIKKDKYIIIVISESDILFVRYSKQPKEKVPNKTKKYMQTNTKLTKTKNLRKSKNQT